MTAADGISSQALWAGVFNSSREITTMFRITRALLPLGAILFVLMACGNGSAGSDEPQAAPDTSNQARLIAPGDSQEGGQDQLPPGHPPIDTSGTGGIPPVPAGAGTGASGLAWTTPASWEEVPPASSMRRAQYRVPGPGGDGECVVFYFGPGQGGGAMANAERWAGQFAQADGSPAELATREVQVGSFSVLMVEVDGTYSGGMTMMGGANQSLDGYKLLGAIAEGPDANWFFKLTGPAETLNTQREAFEGLIQSLRSGA
jgi:hypothetical protein